MRIVMESLSIESLRDDFLSDLDLKYEYERKLYYILDKYNYFQPYTNLALGDGLDGRRRFYRNGDFRFDKIWEIANSIRKEAIDRLKQMSFLERCELRKKYS